MGGGKLRAHLVVQPERRFEDEIVSIFGKSKKTQALFVYIREQQHIRVFYIEAFRVLLDRKDLQEFDGPVIKAALENEDFFPKSVGGKYVAQRIAVQRRRRIRRQVGKIESAGNKADYDTLYGIVVNAGIRQHQFRAARRTYRPEGCQVKDLFRAFHQGEGFKFKLRPALGAINGFFHQGSFPPETSLEFAVGNRIFVLLDQPPKIGKTEKHGSRILARVHTQRYFAHKGLIDHDFDLRVFVV
jgi:hypothetical protein